MLTNVKSSLKTNMKLRKEHFVKLDKPELSNYTHLKCKFCTQDVECLTFICPSIRNGFEKDLKYFEEHQQIFEGWEFVESKSKSNPYYNGEEHFIKGGSMITIHDKGFCVSKDHVTIYYGKNGPNAVEILKLICKDNNIEL